MDDLEFRSVRAQVADLKEICEREGILFLKAMIFTETPKEWATLVGSAFGVELTIAGLTRESLVNHQLAWRSESEGQQVEERRIVCDLLTGEDPTDAKIDAALGVMKSSIRRMALLSLHERPLTPNQLSVLGWSFNLVYAHLSLDACAKDAAGLAKILSQAELLLTAGGTLMVTTRILDTAVQAVEVIKASGFSGTQRIVKSGDLTTIVATKSKRPS